MNTQTFAHTQAFTAINDDALIAVNGGGAGASILWGLANVVTLGIPIIVDEAKGGSVTKAAANY